MIQLIQVFFEPYSFPIFCHKQEHHQIMNLIEFMMYVLAADYASIFVLLSLHYLILLMAQVIKSEKVRNLKVGLIKKIQIENIQTFLKENMPAKLVLKLNLEVKSPIYLKIKNGKQQTFVTSANYVIQFAHIPQEKNMSLNQISLN